MTQGDLRGRTRETIMELIRRIMLQARVLNPPDDYAWPWWQVIIVTAGVFAAGTAVAMGLLAL